MTERIQHTRIMDRILARKQYSSPATLKVEDTASNLKASYEPSTKDEHFDYLVKGVKVDRIYAVDLHHTLYQFPDGSIRSVRNDNVTTQAKKVK